LIATSVLISEGIPAAYTPMDRCVDQHFHSHNSFDLDQTFYDYVRARAAHLVVMNAYPSKDATLFRVPVVTGFLGNIPNGLLQVVGRGYSDFTAALVAAGLKTFDYLLPRHLYLVDLSGRLPEHIRQGNIVQSTHQNVAELQVWKEVDGIFTADPRQVPTAQLLRSIYPDEAAELTYYGSEVIHPFTMEQVMRTNVSIR
jgi:aspartate kinase